MESKTRTPFREMKELLQKSARLFYPAVLMLLLPVVAVNCYLFYIQFHGITISGMDDLLRLAQNGGNDFTFSDYALSLLNYLLSMFADAFVIILAIATLKSADTSALRAGDILRVGARRIPGMIVLEYFFSAFLSTAAMGVTLGASLALATMELARFSAVSIAIGGVILLALASAAIWLVCIAGAYFYQMMIAYCVGRSNLFFSVMYVGQMLKQRTMKTALRLIPWVLLTVGVPTVLESCGVMAAVMGGSLNAGIALYGVSSFVKMLGSAFMWMYLVPRFFHMEEESGVQDKLRQAMDNARRAAEERTGVFYPKDKQDGEDDKKDS